MPQLSAVSQRMCLTLGNVWKTEPEITGINTRRYRISSALFDTLLPSSKQEPLYSLLRVDEDEDEMTLEAYDAHKFITATWSSQ